MIEAISAIDPVNALRRAKLTSFKVFDSLGTAEGESFSYACLLDDRTEQHRVALTPRVLQTVSAYIPTVLYWSDQPARETAFAA